MESGWGGKKPSLRQVEDMLSPHRGAIHLTVLNWNKQEGKLWSSRQI